eukprot:SAG11_NODE_481_length_9096_cov_5.142381_3_plen_82_part_00
MVQLFDAFQDGEERRDAIARELSEEIAQRALVAKGELQVGLFECYLNGVQPTRFCLSRFLAARIFDGLQCVTPSCCLLFQT